MLSCRVGLAYAALCAVLLAGSPPWSSAQEGSPIFVSPAAPFVPSDPLTGTVKIVGSDTMQPIAEYWVRGLARFHPDAKFQFDCRGSETAIEALPKSEAVVALMSRPLSTAEIARLKESGASVVGLVVGHDALAIVVHPDNPVEEISREQLQAAFAATDNAGLSWGSLGLGGEWEKLPVKVCGRDPDSVSRATVLGWLLDDGQKERKAAEFLTNAEVAAAVAADRHAIGYVTRTAAGEKVKIVPLKLADDRPSVRPTDEAVGRREYPLVRSLHVVVRHSDDKPIGGLQAELVRYALSRRGQADVVKDGFLPLSRPELNTQLDRLGWNTRK
jgi:phosphate transport system substrate-binding protein